MPKKRKMTVMVPYVAWCDVTIETDGSDYEEIVELAMEHAGFSSYAGNGARSGKLIGTNDSCVTVYASDEPIEGELRDVAIKVLDENGEEMEP